MALDDTFQPLAFYFDIPQGTHFHLEFPHFIDADTGERFDFTADTEGTWTARMEVRTKDGSPVAAFATSGENGVITLGSDGVVQLDLNAAYTVNLSEPGVLLADLELTDPADDEPWRFYTGRGRITREVTSG